MLYSPWQMSHTTKKLFLSLPPAILIHKHAFSALSIYLSILNIAFPQTPLYSARIKCRVDPAIPLPITSRQLGLMLSQLALHTKTHKDLRLRNADLLPRAASRPWTLLFFCFIFSNSKTSSSPTLTTRTCPRNTPPLRKNANLSLKIGPVESCTEKYKRKKMEKKRRKERE